MMTSIHVRIARPSTAALRGHRALLSNAGSLLGTTGVTALLGFVFWWLAAQLFPVAAVGYGAAAVSAMTLFGTFGMLGLNTVLIGELARRPRGARGLLAAGLLASAGACVVLGVAFIVAAALIGGGFAPYLSGAGRALIFLLGVVLTGTTLVLDEALIGMLRGGWQLWRNIVFAVMKLVALALLVLVLHDRLGVGILTAWVAGTAVSVLPLVVLAHRRGIRVLPRPDWHVLRGLTRVTSEHTWLNNALQAPRLVLPLMVTGILSAAAGGAFYVGWMIANLAYLLPHHLTTVLYAIGAADTGALRRKLRFTLRLSLLGGLVGVPVLILVAHPGLQLYGSVYADMATRPLQILALGYFPSVVKNHYIAVCRVHGRLSEAAWIATGGCVVRLAAAAVGALAGGLTGLSLGLLAAMCAEGAVTAPTVVRAARGAFPSMPTTEVSP